MAGSSGGASGAPGTGSAEWLTVADWIDTPTAKPASVRRVLLEFVDEWQAASADHISGLEDREAIDDTAATFAAMRSLAAVPRVVRMALSERTDAYGYLIALMVGDDEELERRQDDVVHAERMLGLRSGHGGGLAESAALRIEPPDVLRMRPSDQMKQAVAGSTDAELELVRLAVQFLRDWTPLLAPIVLSEYGAKGSAFRELLVQLFAEIPAGFYPVVVVSLLSNVHRRERDPSEIDELIALLTPGVVDIELLKSLPESEHPRLIGQLPQQRRLAIEAASQTQSRSRGRS